MGMSVETLALLAVIFQVVEVVLHLYDIWKGR